MLFKFSQACPVQTILPLISMSCPYPGGLATDAFSFPRHPAAIRPAAVEVDQNIARLGAFAGANDAAVFQLVHNARGSGVAQAQASLHEGNTGFLLAPNDFDTLLD